MCFLDLAPVSLSLVSTCTTSSQCFFGLPRDLWPSTMSLTALGLRDQTIGNYFPEGYHRRRDYHGCIHYITSVILDRCYKPINFIQAYLFHLNSFRIRPSMNLQVFMDYNSSKFKKYFSPCGWFIFKLHMTQTVLRCAYLIRC